MTNTWNIKKRIESKANFLLEEIRLRHFALSQDSTIENLNKLIGEENVSQLKLSCYITYLPYNNEESYYPIESFDCWWKSEFTINNSNESLYLKINSGQYGIKILIHGFNGTMKKIGEVWLDYKETIEYNVNILTHRFTQSLIKLALANKPKVP